MIKQAGKRTVTKKELVEGVAREDSAAAREGSPSSRSFWMRLSTVSPEGTAWNFGSLAFLTLSGVKNGSAAIQKRPG